MNYSKINTSIFTVIKDAITKQQCIIAHLELILCKNLSGFWYSVLTQYKLKLLQLYKKPWGTDILGPLFFSEETIIISWFWERTLYMNRITIKKLYLETFDSGFKNWKFELILNYWVNAVNTINMKSYFEWKKFN